MVEVLHVLSVPINPLISLIELVVLELQVFMESLDLVLHLVQSTTNTSTNRYLCMLSGSLYDYIASI